MNEREWTIMIYMAGDNNLAVDMAYAMEQIKGVAGTGPNSPNIFVYYDGNSPAIPTLYCDFSDANAPKYVASMNVPDKLYRVPVKQNENAADKRSIANFVHWCLNDVEVVHPDGEISYGRRARRYAMIFSGHSLGFQNIGLFRDETSGRSMKMDDLWIVLNRLVNPQEALDKVAEGLEGDVYESEKKLLIGQPLDLLGFDSCVMGMLEVGYQFSDVTRTMIASEGSVPSAGWTYAKILGALASGHHDYGSNAFAEKFVRDFIKSQDAYTVGGLSVDMAAWDMSKLAPLVGAFDVLANVLLECFDEPDVIYRQMERAILNVHWKCQSYMYDQNVDLGDFCELLAAECDLMIADGDTSEVIADLRAKCKDLIAKLKEAVIISGFSGGGYQYSNGISVFFPWSSEGYEVSKKNYESLFIVKDIGRDKENAWPGFLKRYLYEVAMRRSAPIAEGQPSPDGKFRYISGIPFESSHTAVTEAEGRLAGEKGSKLAGEKGSKLAGEKGSKLAGEMGSKLAGETGSKLAGEKGSKLAGEMGSKLAGEKGSKLAGEKGSKLAGEKGSKLAGEKGSKLAGEKGSKLAGEKGSKLAGSSVGGGFFDSLRLYKNIESPWNISGFTKPEDN